MRKRRPWFMLALALTSGIVAALLALRYLRERTTPLMAAEPKRASIVLTARSLPIGAVLTERDLKMVSWPAERYQADISARSRTRSGAGSSPQSRRTNRSSPVRCPPRMPAGGFPSSSETVCGP